MSCEVAPLAGCTDSVIVLVGLTTFGVQQTISCGFLVDVTDHEPMPSRVMDSARWRGARWRLMIRQLTVPHMFSEPPLLLRLNGRTIETHSRNFATFWTDFYHPRRTNTRQRFSETAKPGLRRNIDRAFALYDWQNPAHVHH